jgi:cytochrome bd-type quinol oxidase subunit 1
MGFMGMYTVLSILFIILVYRIIANGPAIHELADTKGLPITGA